MADIPPWLEQLISTQTKQLKMLMEEQAKQQKEILQALTLKTRQEDRFAREHHIDKFPVIKNTDYVEMYIQSFEERDATD